MRFGRDVLSGLGLSFWSLVIGLGAVPLYIRYLGIEAYGLIGFFVTLQAVFQFLDLGLSPAINREVAQAQASGRTAGLSDLLRSLELVFVATAMVIAGAVVVLAPFLARHWLKVEALTVTVVVRSLTLIGVTIACRWPVGLYLGVLMGAHRITLANLIAIIATTASTVGAVAVLALVSPTPEAFFAWQAAVGLLQATGMRAAAWRIVGPPSNSFSLLPLRRVWRFSLAMSGVALSGVLFMQLDKMILSRLLPLSQFGQYVLATTLAGTLYRVVTPVYNAIFPRFSAMVTAERSDSLRDLYRLATSLLASVLFPGAMVMVIFGRSLVQLWTGNAVLAADTAPLVGLLAAGTALHGVMYMPYALQLAYGAARLPLRINLLLMVMQVPLTVLLSVRYGAAGGAAAWLLLHLTYVALGTWLTHRELLPKAGGSWLAGDVGIPLLTSSAIGLVAWRVMDWAHLSVVLASVAAVVTGIIAVAVALWFAPHSLRRFVTVIRE